MYRDITWLQENGTIGIQEVYKQCGVSVGCLSQCNYDSCSHLITWEMRKQYVRFQFLAHVNQLNIGENFYQSIALSEDKFMVSKRENVLLEIADDKYMFPSLGSNFF